MIKSPGMPQVLLQQGEVGHTINRRIINTHCFELSSNTAFLMYYVCVVTLKTESMVKVNTLSAHRDVLNVQIL